MPAFHGMWIDPLIMTVPDIATALRFNIRTCVIGICILQRGGGFSVAEGPQLHALHDAAIRIPEHPIVFIELVYSAVIVVGVDPEYTQHVFVVAIPAQVFAVIDWPRRYNPCGMADRFCHGI